MKLLIISLTIASVSQFAHADMECTEESHKTVFTRAENGTYTVKNHYFFSGGQHVEEVAKGLTCHFSTRIPSMFSCSYSDPTRVATSVEVWAEFNETSRYSDQPGEISKTGLYQIVAGGWDFDLPKKSQILLTYPGNPKDVPCRVY